VVSAVGVVRCEVEYGDKDRSYVDSVPYHVMSLPSVTVDPIMASVYVGQTLTITCQLTSNVNDTSLIYWIRNGRQLTEDDGSFVHNSPCTQARKP